MGAQVKSPAWVYLDFNVIVDILKEKFTLEDVKKSIGHSNVVFPFSLAHIEEVNNIKQSNDTPRRSAIIQHLALIDQISKRQYLEKDDSDLYYKKKSWSAFDVFENISKPDAPYELPYDYYANALSEEQKQEIRKVLGIESKTLNNVEPSKIIDHLDSLFALQHDKATFLEIIELGKKRHSPDYKWHREMDISSVFAILDTVGYWKDRITASSNIARAWDAHHCGIASYCDILVTQDKKTKIKAQVAFNLFDIQTKILTIAHHQADFKVSN